MPSTMRERLLAAAAVRIATVKIGDDTFHVREVSAGKFSKYGDLIKTDRPASVTFLLQECVIDEDGKPCLSVDDAQLVADCGRLAMPLISEIMRLSGYTGEKVKTEKKPDAD